MYRLPFTVCGIEFFSVSLCALIYSVTVLSCGFLFNWAVCMDSPSLLLNVFAVVRVGCRLNDVIVSVNGISTENVTHAQAVEALKRAGRSVLLVSVSLFLSL